MSNLTKQSVINLIKNRITNHINEINKLRKIAKEHNDWEYYKFADNREKAAIELRIVLEEIQNNIT